jgi:hypothetical protein
MRSNTEWGKMFTGDVPAICRCPWSLGCRSPLNWGSKGCFAYLFPCSSKNAGSANGQPGQGTSGRDPCQLWDSIR